jgi:hypothetical protein
MSDETARQLARNYWLENQRQRDDLETRVAALRQEMNYRATELFNTAWDQIAALGFTDDRAIDLLYEELEHGNGN